MGLLLGAFSVYVVGVLFILGYRCVIDNTINVRNGVASSRDIDYTNNVCAGERSTEPEPEFHSTGNNGLQRHIWPWVRGLLRFV